LYAFLNMAFYILHGNHVGRITRIARLSVCPSVCPSVSFIRALNLKTKTRKPTKIGVNVPQGKINRCANFQFKKSKVKVKVKVTRDVKTTRRDNCIIFVIIIIFFNPWYSVPKGA